MSNLQEKFYNLLQEVVQYEVEEKMAWYETEQYHLLKTRVERLDGQLRLLERRHATLNRNLYNDGR